MTFITDEKGTVSTTNSETLADGTNTTAYNKNSGSVTSATVSTVVLGSGSGSDDVYNTFVIEIISGTGNTQAREVTDYVGGTTTATLGENWEITPDSTSTYIVHQNSGKCVEQTQNITNKTLDFKPTDSSVNDFYNQNFIKILGGSGTGQIRKITDYNGTTKIANIDTDWQELPDVGVDGR